MSNNFLANASDAQLREFLLDLLIEYAYKTGDFLLSSGSRSSFYINCKLVTLRGQGALAIGKLFFSCLPSDTSAVAGLTLGADPLVSAVSIVSAWENHPIDALIVRKEAKGHGTNVYIEGPSLSANAHVVVLEDVVTTGKSAFFAVEKLRLAGYKVTKIITVVDRQEGGREFYQQQGLEFQSLFTIADLQKAASLKSPDNQS